MEAMELRIGNFVELQSSKEVYEIISLDREYCECRKDNHSTTCDYEKAINPIPLTEGWLLKFGFDNNSCIPTGVYTLFETLQVCDDGSVLAYENSGFIIIGHIEYVHQLQNLYFALTGKELEIK